MNRFTILLATGISAIAFASAAHAADLIIEEPMMPGIVETSGNWDGVYIGVFGGGAWGTADVLGTEVDLSGWLVGAALGANFTLTDGIILGVVGDIAWSDISGSGLGADFSTDWQGSVRARLGYDAGAWMPYVTGGLAVASMTIDDVLSDSATHVGWTAGAGIEFAATEDLSIDLLYRYSDFGEQEYFGATDVGLTSHQVTVGLNWKF